MKHIRRTLAAVLALTLALGLAACGADNDSNEPDGGSNEPQKTETVSYAGDYADRVSQRATMKISEDGSRLNFEIAWGSSAFESNVWTMSGTLSGDGDRVDYTDGRLVVIRYGGADTAAGDGEVVEETVYEDGTGCFEIADGVFIWHSDNDAFETDPAFEPMR